MIEDVVSSVVDCLKILSCLPLRNDGDKTCCKLRNFASVFERFHQEMKARNLEEKFQTAER